MVLKTAGMRRPELLAPAGSPECLKAAYLAGADAVYLAGKRFGARAFALNFDEKALRFAKRTACSMGKKLYITLNTIVFEHEFSMLEKTLDFYETLCPDALIIQDLGVASLLKERNSTIPRHLSTQGAYFGQGGYEQLKALGFSRVILPREMSYKEIAALSKAMPDIELEMFVHGAMCYSVSGRCFFSAALGSRSGNRGTCAQPCRREYKRDKSPFTRIFSPKDLCLIDKIQKIKELNIASLKIEGRMKGPEYVYQTVKAYRQAIDEGFYDKSALGEVFLRSSFEGFFNRAPASWQTGENSAREGVLVGIATGKSHNGMAEIKALAPINPGDGVFWFVKNARFGARITWAEANKANSKYLLVRGLPLSIKPNTEIRRSSSSSEGQWLKLWSKSFERRPVSLFWSGFEGTPLAVEAALNGHKLRLESEELLSLALKQGLEDGVLQDKFAVLGEQFKAGNQITSMLGHGLYISASAIKKLKKQLVEALNKLERLAPPKPALNTAEKAVAAPSAKKTDFSKHFIKDSKSKIKLRIFNGTFPFIRDIAAADEWILPWQSKASIPYELINTPISWWLPPILTEEQLLTVIKQLETVEAGEFLCFGFEAFELAKRFSHLKFTLDWCFNICSLRSLDFVRSQGTDAVLSREWKPEDIQNNLNCTRAHCAWNPLISFSRFQTGLMPSEGLQNSHNDRFFMLPLGNGITGLFLEDKLASAARTGDYSIQIDAAISPKENPIQAAKDLNRVLDSLQKERLG